MAADMEDKFASWLKSVGLDKYSAQFASNGYDDLDLLSTLDTDEVKSIIDTPGIGMKGHVLKLEKSTHALQNTYGSNCILKEKDPTDNLLSKKKPRQTSKYMYFTNLLSKDMMFHLLNWYFDSTCKCTPYIDIKNVKYQYYFLPLILQLTLSGGKFVLTEIGSKKDKPWEVFLKQNPKTEKMKYFNKV